MNETYFIALIIIVVITVSIALFVFQSRKISKRRTAEMTDIYNDIVLKDKLNIVVEEKTDSKIFALDPLKKVFVFVYNYDQPVYDIVRLNNIYDCIVKKTGNRIEVSAGRKTLAEEHVTEVYLSFVLNDKSVTDIPVYNEIRDSIGEKMKLTALATDWQKKLKAVIAS